MKVFDKEHCNKLAMLSQSKNRYIALLTSLHMEFLSRKDARENAEAKVFLKEQAALRRKWQKELDLSEEEILRTYDLLEWCDACSLLLCEDQLQPENRKIEISKGPDKKIYQLLQTSDRSISLTPWPFEMRKFTVRFEWRLVRKIQFNSSAEFRKEFLKAPVKETEWNVEKQQITKKKKKI